MKRSLMAAVAALLTFGVVLFAINCAQRAQSPGGIFSDSGARSDGDGVLQPREGGKVAMGLNIEEEGIQIGPGAQFDNLTVFAIFSDQPRSIGAFTTLEKALADGTAEVREMGSEDTGSVANAQVNRLVIDNRGEIALVVLSGTVVTGGKQDRTIAQDFVVGAGKTVDVEAYCVEQNRWEGRRGGVATDGKFKVSGTLANRTVRNASQFKREQGQVWGEVDKINDTHGKGNPTGTLAATLDDAELSKQREVLAKQAGSHLSTQQPAEQVVGLAYAVEGEVRVVRWFMNRELFGLYQDALLRTAAQEALTAKAARARKSGGKPMPASRASSAADVRAFMLEIREASAKQAEERTHKNTRRSYEHKKGYGWSLEFDDDQAAAVEASPGAPPKPAPTVTKGYRAK